MQVLTDFITSRIQENILVVVTVCYVIGASLAKFLPIETPLLQPVIFALIASYAILFFLYRRPYAYLISLPLFLITGLIHTSASLLPPEDPAHLYNLLSQREKVTLTGRIINMPEYDGHKTRFNLESDTILFHTNSSPEHSHQIQAKGKIRLSVDGDLPPEILPGTQIMALVTAGRTYNYKTPGVFNYRMYLADKEIYVTGKINSPKEIIIFRDINFPWYSDLLYAPERWRYHIGKYLRKSLDPSVAGIYQALLIGSRAGIPDSALEQFKASGCMHLLAISGIHMSLLGLMSTLTFAWLLKRSSWLLLHTHVPTIATLLSLIPLICYAFIAGLNTPVLRALLMATLFLIAIVLKRQRSILFIIAAAALFLLALKPLALFTVSFQLSFASVLAIAVLYPYLQVKHQEKKFPVHKITAYTSSALLVSIAASLGALPFMLIHFNRFSLIGPIMNLVVEPFLCLWALPLGLLAIPLAFFAPGAAAMILKLGSLGIIAANKMTFLASKLSFASFWTISPNLLEIFCFYLIVFLTLKPGTSTRQKSLLIPTFIGLILFFTHGLFFTNPSSRTELTYLDVGQGTSTLVRFENGRSVLIDGGSKTSPSFNIGERVISPFLRKKRIWHLDDVIITHPDSDHANGIEYILEQFTPRRLWINGDSKQSWPYADLLQKAEKLGIRVLLPESGQSETISPNSRLTFLQGANANQPGLSTNDKSLVMQIKHRENTFLFPGDISAKVERKLIGDGIELESDILLAAHHGSRGSNSRDFVNKVNPATIVISAGSNSSRMYQDPLHISSWGNEGRTVLITSKSGTITCLSSGDSIEITTYDR